MPQDEVGVRVGDQFAAGVDGVRVSRSPDPRSVEDLATKLRSISATTTPPPAPSSASEMVMCGWEPLLEVHGAEVELVRARAEERGASREIDPAVDPVELERRAAHALLPARVQVASAF